MLRERSVEALVREEHDVAGLRGNWLARHVHASEPQVLLVEHSAQLAGRVDMCLERAQRLVERRVLAARD